MRRTLYIVSVMGAGMAVLAGLIAIPTAAGAAEIALMEFATGARRPTWAVAAPGDTERLFVLEQSTSYVRVLNLTTREFNFTPFLSVTDATIGHESGLLCMAFHPEYPDSPYVYVFYNRGPQAMLAIERHTVSPNPELALPFSAKDILTVASPSGFHNGGWLGFGPDGYLYVSLGDGGAAPGDTGPGHDPLVGNAQSDTTRRGKILRIDVDGGDPYGIPPSNPFFAGPSPRNEYWAKGLRNPWRCAFDRATNDFYISDVGQSGWEEIDFEAAGNTGGENYGWRLFQGYSVYNCPTPCDSTELVSPLHAYDRSGGRCALIGGLVYRGQRIPSLQGCYVFGDYCSDQVWTLRTVGGVATQVLDRSPEIWRGLGANIDFISSFAEDGNGEIYILTQDPNGTIWKIIPDSPLLAASTDAARAEALLGRPAPNPSAAGSLSFRVQAPAFGTVKLGIYGVDGRRVRTLIDARPGPWVGDVTWDTRDERGAPARAGVYFIRLEVAGAVKSRPIVVTR